MKPIILVDMDQVMVNFYEHPDPKLNIYLRHGEIEYTKKGPKEMYEPGFWNGLLPLSSSIKSVRQLMSMGYDVYICTQPVECYPESYSGKVEWIRKYIPELSKKMIMTQNKGLILGDYLIDDSLKWKDSFTGEFIHFDDKEPSKSWEGIIKFFQTLKRGSNG